MDAITEETRPAPAPSAPPPASPNILERLFHLEEAGTNARTEVLAGVTTFLTMAYIIFINPLILGDAGMPKGSVFVATCIVAAVGTMIMAIYRQLSDRARARHGAQRLLRLRGRAADALPLAGRARGRLHLRVALPARHAVPDPRHHRRRHPHIAQGGDHRSASASSSRSSR